MNKLIKLFIFICFIFIFSCKDDNSTKNTNSSKNKIEKTELLNNDFKNYLRNFKEIQLESNKSLDDIFHKYMNMEYNKQLKEISLLDQNKYTKKLTYSKIFYGLTSELPDNRYLLIYYIKTNEYLKFQKMESDMAYFKAAIYNNNGIYLSEINVDGCDIPAFDPTYNLLGFLHMHNDTLHVSLEEYLIKSIQEYNDSIVDGYINSKYYILKDNKFILNKSDNKKSKFVISLNKYDTSILKPF